MKITIVGGGIGGLTVALCLHKAGFEVKIFESNKEIKPLGVGINILPHSVRVLTHLGLQEKIAAKAIETSDLVYFNKFGQEFWTEQRGRFAGYKWPQFSIHRGELQMILLKEVQEKLGENAIVKNHHLRHFEQSETCVEAFFVEKENNEPMHTETSDLLIGADGINSVLRSQLYPLEGPPLYSENVLYRGTARMNNFLNGRSMAMIGSLKQKMVVYPIDPKPDENGHFLINWVANVKRGKAEQMERDWNREYNKEQLAKLYEAWKFDWLDVPAMIREATAVYEFPMSDRDPLEKWSFGRVSLLGDAAHPMYPIGSNGASQAILDADSLTENLKSNPDPIQALQIYDLERCPATAKVVLQNRAKGPDQIMDMMEEWFPKGFEKQEIPHEKLAEVMDNYKKIAGFDVQSLNQKI